MPPPCTVTLKASPELIVTVDPLTIVTLSVLVGTTPPLQVALSLQFPPGTVEEIPPPNGVAWLGGGGGRGAVNGMSPHTANRETASSAATAPFKLG